MRGFIEFLSQSHKGMRGEVGECHELVAAATGRVVAFVLANCRGGEGRGEESRGGEWVPTLGR